MQFSSFLVSTMSLLLTTAASRTIFLKLSSTVSSFGYHDIRQHPELQCRWFAGHNKWSKIRHKKGAKDKARAVTLGRASRAITAAAKDCHGDLSNLRLQSAIAHAKAVQLPKDRIQEAITKATTKGADGDLISLRFDAILPVDKQKVACLVVALTDNRNRTTQQVRATITKSDGELLPTDKLAYLFQHVGLILVEQVKDEDALFECALEAGATNVEREEKDEINEESETKTYVVTTEEKDLWLVTKALQEGGFNVVEFEHRYVLLDEEHGSVPLSPEGHEKLETLLEKLDEQEDVTNVFHNAV